MPNTFKNSSLCSLWLIGNSILGTGYSGDTGKPLLFTLAHGMVTLRYDFDEFKMSKF